MLLRSLQYLSLVRLSICKATTTYYFGRGGQKHKSDLNRAIFQDLKIGLANSKNTLEHFTLELPVSLPNEEENPVEDLGDTLDGFTKIKELKLVNNPDCFWPNLKKTFEKLTHVTRLKFFEFTLKFENNVEDVLYLMNFINQQVELETLNLSFVSEKIMTRSFTAITETIAKKQTIKNLTLEFGQFFSCEVSSIVTMIFELKNLEKLSIITGKNFIKDHPFLQRFYTAIFRSKKLRELTVQTYYDFITKYGMEWLIDRLEKFKRFSSLQLDFLYENIMKIFPFEEKLKQLQDSMQRRP
mgnify:FL=1